LALAAIFALAAGAGTAAAQCDFNVANAKGIKGSMVRDYAPCAGTEHPTAHANTHTSAGTSACTPVTPAVRRHPDGVGVPTDYTFGDKGRCTLSMSWKLVEDCSTLTDSSGAPLGLSANPCQVTFVKSKCTGIYQADGVTPIKGEDGGWYLHAVVRMTLDDAAGGDMTVMDYPVDFSYSTPKDGMIAINSSTAEALIPRVGAGNAGLPPCTSMEVVGISIRAPSGIYGKPFARLGGATRP
jgi:hypothetical protein